MCTIAVDFDGTISADFPKAKAALEYLRSQGHVIVIWSSRNNKKQHGLAQPYRWMEMILLLHEHQIPYDMLDDGTSGKFHAQVYIDDKCWRFENNWDEIISRIY